MARIEILCHRGWWRNPDEQNTIEAVERSFAAGFGIETDLRDSGGELVVSHDPAETGALPWIAILDLWDCYDQPGTLAINVKADGLQPYLAAAMLQISRDKYFVFDMSAPDTIGYLDYAFPVYVRQSDHEPVPVFYQTADGLWLDAFRNDWASAEVFRAHIEAGKRLALVSPEIHGRPHEEVWSRWRSWFKDMPADIALCTDLPAQAREVFDV